MRRIDIVGVTLALATSGCMALMADMYKSTSRPGIVTTEKDPMTGVSFVKPALANRPGAGF